MNQRKNGEKTMKKVFLSTLATTLCLTFLIGAAVAEVTEDDVTGLVELTAANLAKDADGTIAAIVAAEHPYKNKDNGANYVFVYDTDVTMIAHPKAVLVGKSYKGKPDVRGKKFRDEIVAGALANKTGWVDYSYTKPGDKGIHAKKTYYQICEGSDGKNYVVCSGMYAKK